MLAVGGGYTGFVTTLQFMLGAKLNAASAAIGLTISTMYLFIVGAGLMNVHRPSWIMPMTIGFLLQVPVVSSPLISYQFASGALAHITLGEHGLFWFAQLGANWQVTLLQPKPLGAGVNLVAIAASVALLAIQYRRQRGTAS